MDLGFSLVSDILFITKHKNDHNFGPNLNIDKILSVLDSPGHSREPKKSKNQIKLVKDRQHRSKGASNLHFYYNSGTKWSRILCYISNER